MIIVGSRALKKFYPDFRECNDYDFFSTIPEFLDLPGEKKFKGDRGTIEYEGDRFEFQFVEENKSCADFINAAEGGVMDTTPLGHFYVLPPVYNLILKKSHLYRSINWGKHISDFHFVLAKMGREWQDIIRDSFLLQIYNDRLEETKKRYPDKTPSLNKSKYDFFNDNVKSYIEHDQLHFWCAYNDFPLYMSIQDGKEVLCSKPLWDELEHEDRINMAREESFVLSVERDLIPEYVNKEPWKQSVKNSFLAQVKRIGTNLSKGWFRDFVQLNYPEIIDCSFENIYDCMELVDHEMDRTDNILNLKEWE